MEELKKVSSGIKSLDELLGGFKSPAILLIAGTTGVGKTIMSLQMLSEASGLGEKTLYIPITTSKKEKLRMYHSTLDFFDDSFEVHPINRQLSEKDPLTTLIEIGNVIESVKPDRLVIDPITPMGFGFVEQERRRFYYTLDSMLQERDMLTLLVGELVKSELHRSVVSHLSDGIIYLSRGDSGSRADHYMEFIKMRGIDPGKRSEITSRKYLYDITSGGFTVYPPIKPEKDFRLEDLRVEAGIPGLDTMLGGGLLKYSSTLIAGRPGTGKKIFGMQFIYHGLENGEPGLIITFEDSPHQLLMDAKRIGWDLEPFLKSGLLQFICTHPGNIYPAEHSVRIKNTIEKIHARRVFFDGINNLEMSISDNLKLRAYIHSLTSHLKSKNITSVFTTEMIPSGGPGNERIDVAFLMDSVVVLNNSKAKNRRYMCIIKSRGTKHRRSVKEYAITEDGIKLRTDTLI
ncbi:ATPase domain-containing protein [Methanolobus halotolerans]|uniref:non-specific serine/threonine protein kinase n=1 Tax=Methanolobus halotolerans TaxID=2052935 RepID=A0A4E0Q280_9EURY|nr:ATPase domain-containing protein [Methanolobus halotolerans]TGC06751.1 circadian clock protein KaiC [Methanolobus halotolerans]